MCPWAANLPSKPDSAKSPRFVLWATKDPDGANLPKIQIIKGWAEGTQTHELTYDVTCLTASNRTRQLIGVRTMARRSASRIAVIPQTKVNASPVLHLRMIIRHASLRSFFFVIMIVGAFFGAGLYVVPQYLRFVQDYCALQAGGFISMFTLGLGLGLQLTLHVIMPRLGPLRTLVFGLLLLIATYVTIFYIWTPTTPTVVLAPAIFFQGFCISPLLIAAGNIVTSSAPIADVNDISTTYFFVRQLGNTFGVTAATVLFDRRMTLHSSRLLDVSNRLDATTRSTLLQYTDLIHRNGGATSVPTLGALQLFQNNVITQSRLLSYIDVYFLLATLGVAALILIAVTKIRPKLGQHHFQPW